MVFVLILGLIAGGLVVQRSKTAYAAEVPDGDYYVMGKYSISSKKVVIKCEMQDMSDSSILEKEKRTFKITSKTKIVATDPVSGDTVCKGKERTSMLKKMKKKHLPFFIDIKKGKVKAIYVDVNSVLKEAIIDAKEDEG